MKKLTSLVVAGSMVALAACEPGTGPTCRNVTSTGQLMMTGQTTAQGQMTGDLSGPVNLQITATAPQSDGTSNIQAMHTIVLAQGDTLFTNDIGRLIPVSQTAANIEATVTINRGTGRASNASGTLAATGQINYAAQPAPTLSGQYTGTVCGI